MNTKKKKNLNKILEREYGHLSFGQLIKALRIEKQQNQKIFSKQLGITVSSLSDIECGKKIPSLNRAAELAKKLNQSEIGFIELALSDSIRKAGFKYKLSLQSA